MTMESCPICRNPKAEACLMDSDCHLMVYHCPDCGNFVIPRCKVAFVQSAIDGERLLAHKYAAVMLERNLKGQNENVLLDYEAQRGLFFASMGARVDSFYPTSFYDKLQRGFFNIVRCYKGSLFRRFHLACLKYPLRSLLFIAEEYVNAEEAADYMCKEGWLEDATNILDEHSLMPTQGVGVEEPTRRYRITTKGMQRFEESVVKNSSNAFLAMWFGADTDMKYREAVQEAVANAGYHLHVVNAEDYNGFIMDKVINLINDSAFVIADITAAPEVVCGGVVENGVRGGVYWEAGYATGQKKQVILTCRDDDETAKRIHFDLQQYNQIRWRVDNGRVVTMDGREFTDVIVQRVLATVGRGRLQGASAMNKAE